MSKKRPERQHAATPFLRSAQRAPFVGDAPAEEGAEAGCGVEEELDVRSGISKPFDPAQIRIRTLTPQVGAVLKRMKDDAIDLSLDFQRHPGIWTIECQSLWIESLLLKIPLPAFYVAEDAKDHWQVVDGLQRLWTLREFVLNKAFSLRGMEYLKQYENRGYTELPRYIQRRITETQLLVNVIEAGTPPELKYNILKRINTGGMPLTPQEMRHTLNPGVGRDFISELAESDEFLRATNNSVSGKRMADRECVLRFVAFYTQDIDDYDGSLDVFLVRAMILLSADPARFDAIRCAFRSAMILAWKLLGDNAFRKPLDESGRRSPVNKSLFESISVGLTRLPESKHAALLARKNVFATRLYDDLMTDPKFFESISISTNTTAHVRERFERIEDLILQLTAS